MPDSKPGIKNFLDTTAEPLLKLGTAGLGALYVFGLLVSNLHLMAVGVSEFTSLRAQNVMTGSITVLYLASLIALAIPWSFAACTCAIALGSHQDTPGQKTRTCVRILLFAVISWSSAAYLLGLTWGYLYPWGRAWDVAYTHNFWTFKAWFHDYNVIGQQFIEIFGTRKIVFSYIGFSILLAYWFVKLDVTRHVGAPRENLRPTSAYLLNVALMQGKGVTPFIAAFAIITAMVGFADDVYPNIRANLGGGQPDVVELQIEVDDSAKISLPPDFVPPTPAQPGVPTHVGPVVIWYQSDKFLYLAPFVQNDRAQDRLLALDIKLVRLIRYIPASVRISGRKILEIHME
jgi:hypothetical protein